MNYNKKDLQNLINKTSNNLGTTEGWIRTTFVTKKLKYEKIKGEI